MKNKILFSFLLFLILHDCKGMNPEKAKEIAIVKKIATVNKPEFAGLFYNFHENVLKDLIKKINESKKIDVLSEKNVPSEKDLI